MTAPLLFNQAGLDPSTSSFIASGCTGLVLVACTFAGTFYIDRIGRRKIWIWGGTCTALCHFVRPPGPHSTRHADQLLLAQVLGLFYATGVPHESKAGRYAVIIFIELFAVSFTSSWSIVTKLCVRLALPSAVEIPYSLAGGSRYLAHAATPPRFSQRAHAQLPRRFGKGPISSSTLRCVFADQSPPTRRLTLRRRSEGCGLRTCVPRPLQLGAVLHIRCILSNRRTVRLLLHVRSAGQDPRGVRRARRFAQIARADPRASAASTIPSKARLSPPTGPRFSRRRGSPRHDSARIAGHKARTCPARRAPTFASTSGWRRSERSRRSRLWTTEPRRGRAFVD